MSSVEKVVEKWRQEKVRRINFGLLPAGNKSEVIAKFIKLGRNVSQDVLNLYCATGGMEGMDSFCWSLWPLDRIVAENESHARPYVWFADFLSDSHYYCFKYEGPARSSVYIDWLNRKKPECVAESIDEFFTYYLECSEKIHLFHF